MLALTVGFDLSASIAARAKNGRNDSLTPSRDWNSRFARSRSRAIRVTSISITVVSWADVWSDSTIRVAISLRRRVIFSVVPRLADTEAGTEAAAGAADGAAAAGCAAC